MASFWPILLLRSMLPASHRTTSNIPNYPPDPMIPRRLDKYLADATTLSRSDIETAWEQGRIDIRPAEEPWQDDYEQWSLIFEGDRVLLDGEPVELIEPRHYFALHKPEGVISTTSNPAGRDCLEPWIETLPDAIFPVGRLDRPTTGFLLMTDDGDLCYCLLRPRFHVEKEYHLTVRGRVDADDRRLQEMEDGIDIGDNKSPASALRTDIVYHDNDTTVVSVVVDEGRNRMIRRMARRAELHLEHLHRPRIGPVNMDVPKPGEYRRLGDDEVDALWSACGGRKASKHRQIQALVGQAEKWRNQQRPHRRLERWLEKRSSADTPGDSVAEPVDKTAEPK